jgi:hypothetical protein
VALAGLSAAIAAVLLVLRLLKHYRRKTGRGSDAQIVAAKAPT